jgi:hypothetical protein
MRVPQRGRAILRRVSAHDAIGAFRPGDFVLTSNSAGLARLLGWATGSRINHAGVIVDPLGAVVEANPSLFVEARAFRMTSVADYLKAGKPCWIGYVELREGSRQDVVAYVEHLVRAQCVLSATGQLWQALHAILGIAPRAWTRRVAWLRPLHATLDRHAFILREEHCYSSGELVARALERGGFIWDCDPAHVTPADLFERYYLADAPVQLTPKPLSALRSRERITAGRRELPGERATITQFTPRTMRGTTVLAEAPSPERPAQEGMRALLHLGVVMAAGLAVIRVIEEMLRSAAGDA